ncbi:MAG: RluA family pseudouridine synthase [Planctomycetia bacterium]|nr:RluA family pseudouridine synthase [Planctomycetia bacterium]
MIRESAGVVAILKPAGIATQSPPGIPSVETWLRERLHGGDPAGYVGVPHRLDRAVSGVLLMAATPRAARKLSRQFERREIVKTYLAVVHRPENGLPGFEEPVEWRDFIEKLPAEARSRLAEPTSPAAREAVTSVWRLSAGIDAPADEVLLQLEPRTGRMHQLRIQSASRGMPIVGDEVYGSLPRDGAVDRTRPIMLHAWRIAYADPDSGEPMTIEAPLPPHWPAWVLPG